MLLDELKRERRERLEEQERIKQLMRKYPHLELGRELQRLKGELELERKGRAHNHRERQRLGEELEREHLARIRTHRGIAQSHKTSFGMQTAGSALARYTPNSIK